MSPKVSIIIPSYNHEQYISQTLLSVINQTYKNLEIIIIDDGSSDESVKIISQFSDSRLFLIEQKNQGAHAAINLGISKASGDYIAILNSDDIYTQDRIEECVNIAKQLNIYSIITSYIEVINSNGKSLGVKQAFKNMLPYSLQYINKTFIETNDNIKNLLMFNYVATTSNLFFNKLIIDKFGYFSCLRYLHDWDYLLRVAESCSIHIIEKPLLKYRVHQGNTIRENKARMILEICWTIAKNHQKIVNNISKNINSELEQCDFFGQLYHSIQAFNCERVLLTMIFMFNSKDSLLFSMEDILNPEHEIHCKLVSEINGHLTAGISEEKNKLTNYCADNKESSKLNLLKSKLKSLKSLFK